MTTGSDDGSGHADVLRAERLVLVGLLEEIEEGDWATPSLCAGWTVQDVAAHLAFLPVMSPAEAVTGMVRARLQPNRFLADSARAWAGRGREAILAQLRDNAETGREPTGVPPQAVMVDAVVHRADIGRPLGRRFPVSAPAMQSAAGLLLGRGSRWPFTVSTRGSARERVAGRRLVADDLDWTWGDGAPLTASAETLVLLLAGRGLDPAVGGA